MQQDDQTYFQKKLQAVIDKTPLEQRSQFGKILDTLSNLKINSLETLITNLQDPQLDENARTELGWLAGHLGDKKLVKPLLSLFDEASLTLAMQAAHSLRLLKSKRAVAPLIEILKQGQPFEMRQAAAYALAAVPDDRALQALLAVLTDTVEKGSVRGQAAESLAYIGGGQPRVISTLVFTLEDKEAEVRFWSLFSLGELASTEEIPALEKFKEDATLVPGWGSIKDEAASAIEQIKSRNPN